VAEDELEVSDGWALGLGWLLFLAMMGVLAYVLLRDRT
jgi:hypothetical protein